MTDPREALRRYYVALTELYFRAPQAHEDVLMGLLVETEKRLDMTEEQARQIDNAVSALAPENVEEAWEATEPKEDPHG